MKDSLRVWQPPLNIVSHWANLGIVEWPDVAKWLSGDIDNIYEKRRIPDWMVEEDYE